MPGDRSPSIVNGCSNDRFVAQRTQVIPAYSLDVPLVLSSVPDEVAMAREGAGRRTSGHAVSAGFGGSCGGKESPSPGSSLPAKVAGPPAGPFHEGAPEIRPIAETQQLCNLVDMQVGGLQVADRKLPADVVDQLLEGRAACP
jgi:hypothetical protein